MSMRQNNGANLVEMAVAIGLSSFFILLLSSMLSQILRLSTASQNQLIASSAAELVIENAKLTPYEVLTEPTRVIQGAEYQLVVNKTSTSVDSFPLRTIPVQLDLIDNNIIYGSVNGTDGSLDISKKWTSSSGNYLRGTIIETITDASSKSGGLEAVEINVKVIFPFTEGSSEKTLSRSAIIFKDGARF